MNKPKILIIGHGRHGKDALAEILRDKFGLSFKSSSMAASEGFIFDYTKDFFGYSTYEECYNDRHNHRALWYELIKAYNYRDPARLAKVILNSSDCYVGMRSEVEILRCIELGLFDHIIWVDASDRLPLESTSSSDVNFDKHATIIITNNGTLEEFREKALELGEHLNLEPRVAKIGLDVDEVITDFIGSYLSFLGLERHPPKEWKDPRFVDHFHEIENNLVFWKLISPMKGLPDGLKFTPEMYVTARPVPSEVTEAWLKFWGFPEAPVITVGREQSKVSALKGKVDIFLDDAVHNFEELNEAGIECILVTAPHNEDYDAGELRVDSVLDFQDKYLNL